MASTKPQYHIFTEKEMRKDLRELIELHKRCVKSYLVSRDIKFRTRKKFEILYDHYIGNHNIRDFFFLPVPLFVQYLVKGQLKNIQIYTRKEKITRKRKPNKSKRSCSKK